MESEKVKFTATVGRHATSIMTSGRIISAKLEPFIGKEVEVSVREKKGGD